MPTAHQSAGIPWQQWLAQQHPEWMLPLPLLTRMPQQPLQLPSQPAAPKEQDHLRQAHNRNL